MKYTRPFDLNQRARAAQSYRQFQNNLREIRAKFAPATTVERALFRQFRVLVRDFARELLARNDRVNVERLNDLEQHATATSIQYNIQNTIRR